MIERLEIGLIERGEGVLRLDRGHRQRAAAAGAALQLAAVQEEEALVASLELRCAVPHHIGARRKPDDGAFRGMASLVDRLHLDDGIAPDRHVLTETFART